MAREPWEIFGNEGTTVTRREPWEIGDPRHESATGRIETREERTERENLETQYQNMGPGRRVRAGISNMLSGIPVVRNYTGNFISNPEDIDIARRARPNLSGIERMTTGVAAYTPASRAASMGGTALRNLITRSRNPNLGLLGEITTQGTLGASTALIDRPPRTNEEAVIGGLLGFGSGIVGPLGSRLLGPSGTGNRITMNSRTHDLNVTPEAINFFRQISNEEFRRIVNMPNNRAMMREINRIRGQHLSERTSGFVTRIGPAAVGAALGHQFGGVPGMVYGAAAGEVGRGIVRGLTRTPMGQRYLGRQVTPNMAAILNSIGPTYFSNIEDNPTNSATGR